MRQNPDVPLPWFKRDGDVSRWSPIFPQFSPENLGTHAICQGALIKVPYHIFWT